MARHVESVLLNTMVYVVYVKVLKLNKTNTGVSFAAHLLRLIWNVST